MRHMHDLVTSHGICEKHQSQPASRHSSDEHSLLDSELLLKGQEPCQPGSWQEGPREAVLCLEKQSPETLKCWPFPCLVWKDCDVEACV